MVSPSQKVREIETINETGEEVFGIENTYWIGLVLIGLFVLIFGTRRFYTMRKSKQQKMQNTISKPVK